MSNLSPQQQLAALLEETATLRTEIETLHRQQAQLHASQQRETREPPIRKAILPDPVKFDGKAYHFDTWLPAIRAKLRVDHGIFGSGSDVDIAMFYYVYDRLESQVQSQVLPQLARAAEDDRYDYESILTQLERALHNPHRHQEAEDRLHELSQGTDTVAAYVAKFERLLYEAKGHKWDDARKIAAFRHGLNGTIKNRLAQQLELPVTYPAYLKAVQKLSTRATGYTPQASGSGSSHHSGPSSSSNRVRFDSNSRPARDPDAMDTSVGTINVIDTPSAVEAPNPIRRINDSRLKHTSQLGYSFKELGACMRCGSFGHWLADCPQPAPTSAKHDTSSVGVSGQKRVVASNYMDDSDGYDSGEV